MTTITSATRRVQIKLKQSITSSDEIVAQFGKCIVDFFGFTEKGSGYVGFSHMNDELTLFGLGNSVNQPNQSVLMKHASLCPVFHLNQLEYETLPRELKDRGVNIGVAVLLTSADNHVLVTRRASHMRTFPGIWVPPGGHIEIGESLFNAGAREVQEETGLVLSNIPYHVLGLWESVYPHKLEFGTPIRQHIVVYLAMKSDLTWQELFDQIKLDPSETDAAMWLPLSLVEKISTGHTNNELPRNLHLMKQGLEEPAEVVEIPTTGIIQNLGLPENASPVDMERFSWGTRFALQQWVKWTVSLKTSDSKL